MDEQFKEGFERMLADTPEGPDWDELSTPTMSPELPQPTHRRRALVGIGAFVLTVMMIGAVAFLTTRDEGLPVATESTTTVGSVLSENERSGIQIWVNQLGLTQFDESVWRDRYEAMCAEGAWDISTALRLGELYVTSDLEQGLSVRDPSVGLPTAEEAATAVWLMTAQSCRDLIPADTLAAGPPFMAEGDPVSPSLHTSCGPISLGEGAEPDFPTTPLSPDAEAALAATRNLGEEGVFFFDTIDWTIADDENGLLLFGRSTESSADPAYGYAEFERRNDVWAPTGWGQCRLEVEADGWNGSDWVVNPEWAMDPTKSSIAVLVSERECANGEAPGDRAIVPIVMTEGTRITITVLIEPMANSGPNTTVTCPGNPWVDATVELEEPLGGRDLYDGREVPPVLVWSSDGTMLGPNDR